MTAPARPSRPRWTTRAASRCAGRRLTAACAAALFVCAGGSLHAQEAPAGGGGTTIVVQGRTPYLEGAVVLALSGAALFAVCRSSRRN